MESLAAPPNFGRHRLLLLALPLLLLAAGLLLRETKGPAYLAANMEPEYAYLFGSLNLAQGRAVTYADHPGITVQLCGAALLRLNHPFDSGRRAEDALRNPERHIAWLGSALMAGAATSLLAGGLLVLGATGSLKAALIFQLLPFLSPSSLYYGLTRFSAEPLLLALSFLFGALLLRDTKTWLLGLLAALGLATKLTFAPAALLPFFVLGRAGIKRYVAWSALCFAALTLPMLPLYPQFLKWAWQLLAGKGIYGQHGYGLMQAGDFIESLSRITHAEMAYAALLAVCGLLLARALYLSQDRKNLLARLEFRLLAGFVLTGLLGTLLSAKLYSPRYLIPCASCGGALAALAFSRRDIFALNPINGAYKHALGFLLAAFLLLSAWNFSIGLKFNSLCRDSQLSFIKATDEAFRENPKVYFYPVSSQKMALFNGNIYGGGNRGELLERLYPLERTWFVHRFKPELWTWTGPADTDLILEQNYRNLVFLGNLKRCPQPLPGLSLKPLLEGEFCNDESASVF